MTNPFKTQEISGTSTEKDNLATTLTAADADLVFRIVGGDRYKWNGSAWEQISTSGAGHVLLGFSGQARIREEDALAGTAVTFTWNSPGISSVVLQAQSEALAVAGTQIDTVAICIDPPSQAVRDSWLTAADSNSTDSQRILVKANGPDVELFFSTPITKLGAIRDLGANNIRLVAIGTEVA